jgi:lipopolysaccharide biosynthesis protein
VSLETHADMTERGLTPSARLIAFYLPQFHPIPENDAWWGEGFTEWRNVSAAQPLFPGHYQPHLPGELGYYDLRRPEARISQANLAREYGIYGFCYYHYWFKGRRLLEFPFDQVLTSGQPDFPFCLCWANESWTRTWDDQGRERLIEQEYSEADDHKHIQWLITAFQDPRYIRVENKPIFLVYRANKLPNPRKTAALWREEANHAGIGEIYLCRVESFPSEHTDPVAIGFDAAVEFQPDWANLPLERKIARRLALELSLKHNDIYEYAALAERMMRKAPPPYKRFPCVTPSWDNSPRHKTRPTIIANSTPELYEAWLRSAIGSLNPAAPEERLVFVNAWNEWGEGCHLEPCAKWGRGYLEATRRALTAAASSR